MVLLVKENPPKYRLLTTFGFILNIIKYDILSISQKAST